MMSLKQASFSHVSLTPYFFEVDEDVFPLPPQLEDALLMGLSTRVCSEPPPNTASTKDWLRFRVQEQAHDLVVLDRNYLHRLRIHLHLDSKNQMRLVRINVNAPIDSFYSLKENSKEVPVTASSFWLDAWAGPTEDPDPKPIVNAEYHFDLKLSLTREYKWTNYEGIILLDVTALAASGSDKKTKELFHPGVQYVRCTFESGSFTGRFFQYSVLVLDTWTLKNPEEFLLANIPQSSFCSAIFLGDRLIELGTDNGCVVISIVCKPPRGLAADDTATWTCTVAWDDKQRLHEDVDLNDIEVRFMLVSKPQLKIFYACSLQRKVCFSG